MEKEIKEWLQGSRDFYVGVTLYNKYGHNRVLKNRFSSKSSTTQALLLTELCKLANLTEDQAQRLPRKAKTKAFEYPKSKVLVSHPDDIVLQLLSQLGVTTSDLESEDVVELLKDKSELDKIAFDTARKEYVELPEVARKTIKIREEFPFLKEDNCPDAIKLLVHDMFTEYDKYRAAHKRLSEAPENEDLDVLFTDAQTTVESYLSNRQIWEELEHYKEHGTILGAHPKLVEYTFQKEIEALDDAELLKKRNNARSNVSKAKKAFEALESDENKDNLSRWEDTLNVISKELDSRKK